MYGGTGTESANLRHPSRPPESLEAGTLNLPGIAALNAGLRWTEKRFEKNNAKIERISRYLHKELRERDIETFSTDGSPLLTFRIKGFDSAGIADFLDKTHDIAIRPGLHCAPLVHRTFGTEKGGLARVSIGAHNTIGDAKKLLSAIDELRSTR